MSAALGLTPLSMHHVEAMLWRCLNAQCFGSPGDIAVAPAHSVPVSQFLVVGQSYFTVRINTWVLLAGREEGTKVTLEVINQMPQCKMLRSSLKNIVKSKLDRQ